MKRKKERTGWLHPSSLIPHPFGSAGLVLAQQLAEARVVADRVEVAVLAHVAEIAVAQLDRPPQRLDRLLGPLHQGVTARQVVVDERVARAEAGEALVDLQALGVAALEGE